MDSFRSTEKTGEMGMQKITHPQDNPQNSNSLISKFTSGLREKTIRTDIFSALLVLYAISAEIARN